MNEIKLTLDDPARAVEAIRYVVSEYLDKQHTAGMVGEGANAPILDRIADSIEAQVKTAIEDPLEFGSIVRAAFDEHSDRVLWQRGYKGGWSSEDGALTTWTGLHIPEVLRVGVGDTLTPITDEAAYDKGVSDTVSALVARLQERRAGAIHPHFEYAYNEAIKTAEAL